MKYVAFYERKAFQKQGKETGNHTNEQFQLWRELSPE